MARDGLIGQTFVQLADTLVDGYDVVEFVHVLSERCVSLSEAGVMLVDAAGQLRVLASSSERMRLIELFELQNDDGPCRDAWRSAEAVIEPHLADGGPARWPTFAPVALENGFGSVYAFPMRMRNSCIGALNLFADEAEALSADDQALAQAMADVATIGILNERFARDQAALTDQLQSALNSRVVIEQAKGAVAAQLGVSVDDAFVLLRTYARSHNARLAVVAADVVSRRLHAASLSSTTTAPLA